MVVLRRAVYGSVSGLMAGMLGGLVAGFLFGLVITIFSHIGPGVVNEAYIYLFLGYPSVSGLVIGGVLGLIIGAIAPRPSYNLLKMVQLLGGFIAVVPSILFFYVAGSIINIGIMIIATFLAGMVGGTVAGRFYRSILT